MNAKKIQDESAIEKAHASHNAYFEQSRQENGDPKFDTDLLSRLHLIEASDDGWLAAEVDLGQDYTNIGGVMHGAIIALLFDMCTSFVFAPTVPLSFSASEEFRIEPPGGTSRSLNMTYLRPAPLPGKYRVESKIIQNGRRMGLVKGSLMSLDRKKVYAICEHHKVKNQGVTEKIQKASRL